MLDQSKESLLYLFYNASYITGQVINLDLKDRIMCLAVHMDIEKLDRNDWGRGHEDGYQYKLHSI